MTFLAEISTWTGQRPKNYQHTYSKHFSPHYIDLAKPKSGARIFFSRTSQGHNALPRPGLEPGSSDSEPSALTTGLLNKAVALACPRYSWPRMLKVAPCTVVRLYGRKSKFFPLDGLLLFCIIMGLRSASSAIKTIQVRKISLLDQGLLSFVDHFLFSHEFCVWLSTPL